MTIRDTTLTPKYFVLDLEVHSVPRIRGEPQTCITQIAVKDPSRKKGSDIFNMYIKPPKELRKPGWEKKFKKIPSGKVASFQKAWPKLVDWIGDSLDGNRKAIIVMHNGFEHDWKVLKTEVARNVTKTDLAIPKFWKPFDTYWLKNALHIEGRGSVTALCHKYNIEVLDAHDAVNDVKMTDEIFLKMVGSAPLGEVLTAALDENHPITSARSVIEQHSEVVFAVYDFEADGLFPRTGEFGKNPRAVQLAVLLPSVKKVFDEKINPGIPISRESSAIHGIYDGDVKDAPGFKVVWLNSEKFIESNVGATAKKVVYVGHNIWGYDNKLYKAECERTGLKPKWLKSVDTYALLLSIFKGNKGIPRRGFFKQEYITPLFGIDVVDAHDAKGDVLGCWRIFEKIIDGVDRSQVSRAVLSKHPILGLAQLCRDHGTFNSRYYWELYQKICGMTVDLAKQLFKVPNEEFYAPANLAALLDITIHPNDKELYTNWRIFLKLTEGILRADINKAFETKDPMAAVIELCNNNDQFTAKKCMSSNDKAIKSIVDLAKNMYPDESENFYRPINLANELDIPVSGRSMTPFEKKRLFMELTKGIRLDDVREALLSDDTVERLGDFARTRGTLLEPEPIQIETLVEEVVDDDDGDDSGFSSFSTYFNPRKRDRIEASGSSNRKRQKTTF